ncbi:type I DNA topoisomerase [SAR86 cluster bacterium]|nr:type I DNA topoisomerase [SAR86 cluster bacterium]
MKNLVIVESGAKATKITGFLNKNFPKDNWRVEACLGHIRDLPDEETAVNPDNWTDLKWKETQKGKKTIKEIRKLCKEVDCVYLATDPDREGEAIAWHLKDDFKNKKLLETIVTRRITFNEITSSAIKSAVENPREIDQNLVDAYLTRRILDHLIGFKVSPFLWRHVSRAKSAGRVQSPSLRIICEREDERDAHVAKEYWPIKAKFKFNDLELDADLIETNGVNVTKEPLNQEKLVNETLEEIRKASFFVSKIETKPQSSSPKAPFRTSTLQMSAASSLGFTADRTMRNAQNLYEGGLITYLRTDGISISTSPNTGEPFSEEKPGPPPLQEIRNLIKKEFDETFLSEAVRVYKSKVQNSQEAHEAIRPTNISNKPKDLNLSQDEQKLYELIWNRTVASQMVNSKHERKNLTISSQDGKYLFRAASRKNLFLGFEVLTKEDKDSDIQFPEELVENETLDLISESTEQKFTLPPNRYSEASLIKRMEEEGIGRPSTYASTVKGLRDKKYAYGAKSIAPSDLGRILTSYLKSIFKDFFIETRFTAEMENNLDEIASGNLNWKDVLDKFWEDLQNYLNRKINDIEISNKDEFKTRQVLDLLNEELHEIIFPKAKNGEIRRDCPKCSSELSLKSGAWGYFVGCSECKWTKKPFEFNIDWETYQVLPKEIGIHPEYQDIVFADISINGPCVWTMKEEKKIFGSPDEDEDLLDIGLNRAVELIERDSGEHILFTETNSGIPVLLKNGRFGEYTEFDGFNKATKLPPEDKPKNPKVSYYDPHQMDYENKETRAFVLKSLRILGFHPKSNKPIGIKIRKPGKAFKFVKFIKCGDKEIECPSDFYKLEEEEQHSLIKEALAIDEFKIL